MTAYIARRILLMVPTLLGILLVSFAVVQFAPGGPVERVIAQLSGADTSPEPAATSLPRNIVARRASIPISSRAWRSSSASTGRRMSVSC
jgi:microcin C transport system permease protein